MITCAMLARTSWALALPRKLDWTRLKGWNASGQTLFFFYLSYQIFFFSLLTFLSFLFILLKTQPPALQKSWLTAACNHVDVDVDVNICCLWLEAGSTYHTFIVLFSLSVYFQYVLDYELFTSMIHPKWCRKHIIAKMYRLFGKTC